MSTRAMKLSVLNTAQLNWSKHTLPGDVRLSAIEILNAIVVETIDVALSARHAHWNVRGPNFTALHELFGHTFNELNQHIDALAERAAALGGVARGTLQDVASETKLKPYPMFSIDEHEHIEAMATRLGQIGGEIRPAIDECAKIGDPVSADLLTQACATVDKLLWRVGSHQVSIQP